MILLLSFESAFILKLSTYVLFNICKSSSSYFIIMVYKSNTSFFPCLQIYIYIYFEVIKLFK